MNASKWIRKGLALALMAALLLTMLPATALAASFSAVVTSSEMTVYKSASMTGTSATLPKGTVVTVKAYKGNIAKISYKGHTGYASVSDMEPVKSEATQAPEVTSEPTQDSGEKVTLRAALRVYQKASTGSKSMSVPAGTSVSVLSSSGGWVKLSRSGNIAYALADELAAAVSGAATATATPAVTATPTAAPTDTPAPTATPIPAVVTSSKLPVYEKADTQSKVLGTMKQGETLNVQQISGDWARVEKDGKIGYALKANLIPASDVTPVPTATATPQPESTPIPATVKASKLTVYQKPSSGSKVLGTLLKGDTLNVQAISGNWALVEKDGKIGYALKGGLVPTASVTATPVVTETPTATATPEPTASAIPATVSVERLVIYQKASTSSAKLGTLQLGDTLNVQAISGSWARVEKDGKIGYCKKAGLTPTADVTPVPSATVEPTVTPDATEVKFQATVVSSTMTVYASNSTSSAKLGTLKAGTLVDVYAYEGDWAYIGVGDKRGFAQISCMSGSSYKELSSGDSGDAVQKLNDALLKLGYYDAIPSSKYDSATTAAVKRLQAAMNETQTGTAGAALQRIIYAGNAPKSPILSMSLNKGDVGTNVQRIQQRLYALGYLSKSSSVDADYGATTQKAVSLFQKAAGMTESGKADSSTIQKLYSASAPRLPSGTNAADVAETPAEDPDKGSTDNSPLSSEGQAKVETIVAAAKEKLGCKYVFAAMGPDTFDCSGLVKYCYSKVGISIPHSAYSIGYGSATKIAYSGLVRGDIVCLNTLADSDLSDHVGIYLGGGQFIHASSGKAQVIISDLTSGYYNRVFSWGKRYIH